MSTQLKVLNIYLLPSLLHNTVATVYIHYLIILSVTIRKNLCDPVTTKQKPSVTYGSDYPLACDCERHLARKSVLVLVYRSCDQYGRC